MKIEMTKGFDFNKGCSDFNREFNPNELQAPNSVGVGQIQKKCSGFRLRGKLKKVITIRAEH